MNDVFQKGSVSRALVDTETGHHEPYLDRAMFQTQQRACFDSLSSKTPVSSTRFADSLRRLRLVGIVATILL